MSVRSVAAFKRGALAMLSNVGAPLTRAHLHALAVKYERAYRRARASKAPPSRELLLGQLQCARALYSLARGA